MGLLLQLHGMVCQQDVRVPSTGTLAAHADPMLVLVFGIRGCVRNGTNAL